MCLNRFESRKNLKLAVKSYLSNFEFFKNEKVKLVVAGGLNQNSQDCRDTLEQIEFMVCMARASEYVDIKINIKEEEKDVLIK